MRHRRVLVVDDERLIADTLGLIFRRRGFECEVAYSGEQALEQLQTYAPSLMLLDIHMPGMSGLDVARSVARSHPKTRMLMMTGYYNRLREVREYSNSLSQPLEFATKPVQPDTLLKQASLLLATV